MRKDLFRSHSFLGQFLFSWMMPKRLSVGCGNSAPPAATAATAPAPKSRTSRRVQRRKSWGATSISCGGRSWKKVAGLREERSSGEDVLSGSPAEVLSSGFIVKSPRISPSSSTNLRSCCEACPSRQQERESRAVQQREQKTTSARSARCALCHNHQKSRSANRAAWVCEWPIP